MELTLHELDGFPVELYSINEQHCMHGSGDIQPSKVVSFLLQL